jgi:hypothetical protein
MHLLLGCCNDKESRSTLALLLQRARIARAALPMRRGAFLGLSLRFAEAEIRKRKL